MEWRTTLFLAIFLLVIFYLYNLKITINYSTVLTITQRVTYIIILHLHVNSYVILNKKHLTNKT